MIRKKTARKPDAVDWNGLLAIGSLFGNVLQAANQAELKKILDLKQAQAVALFKQREGLRLQLMQLKKAFEQIENQNRILSDVNRQLNLELSHKDKEIADLKKKLDGLKT